MGKNSKKAPSRGPPSYKKKSNNSMLLYFGIAVAVIVAIVVLTPDSSSSSSSGTDIYSSGGGGSSSSSDYWSYDAPRDFGGIPPIFAGPKRDKKQRKRPRRRELPKYDPTFEHAAPAEKVDLEIGLFEGDTEASLDAQADDLDI